MDNFLDKEEWESQEGILQEKLEWLKKIGVRKFKEPMRYYLGMNVFYSEEFLKRTPLEELKEKSNQILADKGAPIIIKDAISHTR